MRFDFTKPADDKVYDVDGNVMPFGRNEEGSFNKSIHSTRYDKTGTFCYCVNCGQRRFYTQFKPRRDGSISGWCSKCVDSVLQDRDETNMTNYLASLGYGYYPNIFSKYDNGDTGKTLTMRLTKYIKHISNKTNIVLQQENEVLDGKVPEPEMPLINDRNTSEASVGPNEASIGPSKTRTTKKERDAEMARRQDRSLDDIAYDDLLEEQRISAQLTDDERQSLRLKWGSSYKPSEWVKMENIYNQYASEYEMTVDRENALRNLCKVALKMDQALDDNDVKSYKDLSSTYDMLRKSAKFTDSQRKEQKTRDIDSVGQLVQFVENEGGFIPPYDVDPVQNPQDKIDYMIKDMKHYVDNLVRNELGLGNLIESFIKKEEENKVESVEDMISKGFSSKEDEAVTADDDISFQDFLLGQVEDEAKRLEDGDFEWPSET